jgi:hypothetical protein
MDQAKQFSFGVQDHRLADLPRLHSHDIGRAKVVQKLGPVFAREPDNCPLN